MSALVHDSAVYIEALTDWTRSLLALADNYVTEYLVPPTVLRAALVEMKKKLLRQNLGISLIHHPYNLYFYYRNRLATFLSDGQKLYIKIKVPVGYEGSMLTAYHALVHPVPITPEKVQDDDVELYTICLLYTSPSPRDRTRSRMPSSA